MDKLDSVRSATDSYIDNFILQYDLNSILQIFVDRYGLENQVDVIGNLGWLPFGAYTPIKKFNDIVKYDNKIPIVELIQPTDKRYNVAILNISYGYRDNMIPEEIDDDVNIPHYLGYILDNEKKEIWLLDSLTDNVLTEKKTGFLKFAKALYPSYKIRGMEICSGCGFYEPYEDESFMNQNIFCHTWTLYFIFMIMKGLSSGYEIEQTVDILNSTCGTEKQNLKKIKQFAYFVTNHIVRDKSILSKKFMSIYVPARDVVEIVNTLDSSPILIPEGNEFIIEKILDKKGDRYKVKWAGYNTPTWEPENVIEEDVPQLVEKFKAYSERPKRNN